MTNNALAVARQPAIEVGIFLSVARNTLIHVPGLMRQPLKVLHLSVAFGAGDFAVDVALVIKQYMFGHIIKLYPGRWRVGVEVFVFLFDPRVIGNNVVVAVQTFFHRRYTGMI
mgnify:CR=1 FL=1